VSQTVLTEVDQTDPGGTLDVRSSRMRRLAVSSTLYIGLALLALIATFSAFSPGAFTSAYNVRTVATDASVLLVVAVGATFVIATAGIDLSVGGVLVFSGVVSVKAMDGVGGGSGAVYLGLLVALAAGLGWGIVNGLLVAKAHVPPLIATLGSLGMSMGLAQLVTDGADLRGVPGGLVDQLGLGRLFGVPWLVVIAAAVTVVGMVALNLNRFGTYTLAIGSNPVSARRAGINVDRHLIKVYATAGLLAGLAGYLNLARFATTTIAGHNTDNLQAITAVVIGGTSLFGGVATVLGTVIGVFIPAVLENGFVILGVPPFWQQTVIGAVLVIAVFLDQFKRTKNANR